MKKGLLIVFSGPSGVGKGTIRKYIEDDINLKIAFSVSMTTRKPREGEVDGVDYFFVSEEEFSFAWDNGQLIEMAEFAGNKYGTPLEYVNKLREEGKNVLLEIEVLGAKQVIEKCDDAISIFLLPPTLNDLEVRLRGRKTETEEQIQMRLKRAAKEIEEKHIYSHCVVNNNIDTAVKEVKEIILKEMEK